MGLDMMLPAIWAGIICFSLLAYAVLDGFDLGSAAVFSLAGNGEERDRIAETVAPFWDGNETWLIVLTTAIFGAFPAAYAVLIPALYVPVFAMVSGLIFRGVAFEFRHVRGASRRFWDWAFVGGSLTAAFFQGVAFGAVAQGLPDSPGQVHLFDWMQPAPLLGGVFVVALYSLIGAGWVEGRLNSTAGEPTIAQKLIPLTRRVALTALLTLAGCVVVFLALAVVAGGEFARSFFLRRLGEALFLSGETSSGTGGATAGMWIAAAVCLLITARLAAALRGKAGYGVFFHSAALAAGLLTFFFLACWPYIVPPHLTIRDAAAPVSSQLFLLVGTAVMLPVIVIYTTVTYRIFLSAPRGEITESQASNRR